MCREKVVVVVLVVVVKIVIDEYDQPNLQRFSATVVGKFRRSSPYFLGASPRKITSRYLNELNTTINLIIIMYYN